MFSVLKIRLLMKIRLSANLMNENAPEIKHSTPKPSNHIPDLVLAVTDYGGVCLFVKGDGLKMVIINSSKINQM